jgi:hypothetical protein
MRKEKRKREGKPRKRKVGNAQNDWWHRKHSSPSDHVGARSATNMAVALQWMWINGESDEELSKTKQLKVKASWGTDQVMLQQIAMSHLRVEWRKNMPLVPELRNCLGHDLNVRKQDHTEAVTFMKSIQGEHLVWKLIFKGMTPCLHDVETFRSDGWRAVLWA